MNPNPARADRVSGLVVVLCRVGVTPVPPTERSLVHQGHGLEGRGPAGGPASQCPGPHPVPKDPHDVPYGTDCERYVHLNAARLYWVGVTDENDISRGFFQHGIRL